MWCICSYIVDIDLRKVVDDEALSAPEKRSEARKTIKKVFEERYLNQGSKTDKKALGVNYFFKKLAF